MVKVQKAEGKEETARVQNRDTDQRMAVGREKGTVAGKEAWLMK